jgi:hypothetical protein
MPAALSPQGRGDALSGDRFPRVAARGDQEVRFLHGIHAHIAGAREVVGIAIRALVEPMGGEPGQGEAGSLGQRLVIEADYGMEDGEVCLEVRAALLFLFLRRLGVDRSDGLVEIANRDEVNASLAKVQERFAQMPKP